MCYAINRFMKLLMYVQKEMQLTCNTENRSLHVLYVHSNAWIAKEDRCMLTENHQTRVYPLTTRLLIAGGAIGPLLFVRK